MDSCLPLQKLNKYYIKLLIICFAFFVVGVVFMNLKLLPNPILYNPYLGQILQYVAVIATGILVYLGNRRYANDVQLHKDNPDENFKRVVYIKANRFQNNLIFIALAVNILLMCLTFKQMFLYLSTICFVFNFIYIPSEDKFVSDFVAQINDDRYETEINQQDGNNINQNFES